MAALYKEQLGALIATKRLALGLTQAELAEKIPVKESQTVSRWERGERGPNDLEAVAKALETTAADMLSEIGSVKQTDRRKLGPANETQLDRIERKLTELLAIQRAGAAPPKKPSRPKPPLETTAKKRAVRAKARTPKAADAQTGSGQ